MLRSFSELIGHLYAGALEPSEWKAALEAIRGELHANFVTLAFLTRAPGRAEATLNAGAVPLDRLVLYQNEYQRLAPRPERTIGEVRTINAWRTSSAHESLGRFEELLEISDIDHYMGAWLCSNEDVDCVLRVTRPVGAPPFTSEDEALLELVAPHFARALEIRARLARAEARMEIEGEAMDRLSVGAIVLDESGRILARNAAATRLFDAHDGLEEAGGRLVANLAKGARLSELVEAVRATPPGSGRATLRFASIERTAGSLPLGLALCPIRLGLGFDGSSRIGVAIFVRDPDSALGTDARSLGALFGLTPAEANLALEIAKGESLEDAAERLSIRYNTARAHLRAVFAKTGVTRQAELVRLVLAGAAPLASAEEP